MAKQNTIKDTPNVILKKKYVSQADVPAASLNAALKVGQAITDNYAKQPTKPMHVASAMGLSPSSSYFRLLCGASIAYGITEGGYASENISLTALGRQIFAPKTDGEDFKAKQAAVIRPRILNGFLSKYNNSALPTNESISRNVLEDMGVASNKLKATYELIIDNARSVGFLKEIKGKTYVDLDGVDVPSLPTEDRAEVATADDVIEEIDADGSNPEVIEVPQELVSAEQRDMRLKKVFITHGKNKAFIDAIKKLLEYGELIPVVAVEKSTVAKGLPDKVMDEMRNCGAAIIHVDAEERLFDDKKNERVVLNQNVLIEIGAAMALYGRRFVLLVREGVELPSNLEGLFEVRYVGETLSADVAFKLLDAVKDIKNHPLP
jgi:predicted nucleotide-binding protein